MIDFTKTTSGRGAGGTQPTVSPPAAPQTSPGGPPATVGTSGMPDSSWNPGAMWAITPQKWQDWGGGDTWQSGWYRHPNDPGHVVYNQDYGYQDWQDVFGGADMTANYDISRFADRIAETQADKAPTTSPWGNWQQLLSQFFGPQSPSGPSAPTDPNAIPMGGPSPGTPGTEDSMNTYDWRGPLDTAGDTLNQFAQGMPYNSPWQWGQASDVASQFAQNGMPVNYSSWWEAQQPVLQRTIEDQSKQQAEQAGLSNSRWSTPLQRNISDIAGRETANTFGQFMGMDLQGQEMAKQRQQQAINQLQSLGQSNVGLENMMRQEQLQAAGMLPGLSQTGYGIQSDIARQLMQGGMGMQNMNQQALGNLLNIFGQQNPTLAMLLQAGMGGLGTPSNWAQQQYSQSPWDQFMNMLPF